MRELFDFLQDYGLRRASDVEALAEWDIRHYRRFCEELGDLLEHPSLQPRAERGLVLVPEVWVKPRSSFAALCLYADHIVIPAVVFELARNTGAQSIGEISTKLPDISIIQYLSAIMESRALLEAGIARLARRPPERGQFAAFADALFEPLKRRAEFRLVDEYTGDLILAGFGSRLTLWREEGEPPGEVQRVTLNPADFTPRKLRAALRREDSLLGAFYRHVLHHVTWEILSEAELASSVRGHPVWTHSETWDFLRATLGLPEHGLTAGHCQVHAAALEILEELPFLDGVELDTLAALREDYEPQFHRFRAAMSTMAASIASTPDAHLRRQEAQRIVREEINPAIGQIAIDLESATRKKKRYAGAALATATVGVLGAFLTGEPLVAGLAATTIPFIQKAIEAGGEQDEALHQPLFFVWKAKEGSY